MYVTASPDAPLASVQTVTPNPTSSQRDIRSASQPKIGAEIEELRSGVFEPAPVDIGDAAAVFQRLYAHHRHVLGEAEIAHELGVNPGTVKSRIARARGKLRGLMVESCPEFTTNAVIREWFEPARSRRGAGALRAA